jgi:hypothetical protein
MLQIAMKAEQEAQRKREADLQRQTAMMMQSFQQEQRTGPNTMIGNFSSVKRQKAQAQAYNNMHHQINIGGNQMYGGYQVPPAHPSQVQYSLESSGLGT